MCFMQEIRRYLLFSSCKNRFLVKIYVDLFIAKRKSGQLLHACVLEMLIRLMPLKRGGGGGGGLHINLYYRSPPHTSK